MPKTKTVTPYSDEHAQYLAKLHRRNIAIQVIRIALLIFIIAMWEIGARIGLLDPFIMSSPSRIINTIAGLQSAGNLWNHIGITIFETVVGFVAGTMLGTLIAIALWWKPFSYKVLDPYLVVLNALPKIALGPIIIVWIGAGISSIIVMALLISIVVTIITVLTGFNEIPQEKLKLMETFGASKQQILRMVILPASIPTIISALKVNVGMSWVGVIVGEYLVSKAGLGYLIVYGSQVFKLDLVMASILILCVAAALMYYGVSYIEKKFAAWWR